MVTLIIDLLNNLHEDWIIVSNASQFHPVKKVRSPTTTTITCIVKGILWCIYQTQLNNFVIIRWSNSTTTVGGSNQPITSNQTNTIAIGLGTIPTSGTGLFGGSTRQSQTPLFGNTSGTVLFVSIPSAFKHFRHLFSSIEPTARSITLF
ncbi:hypothetical protein ACTFIY_010494 [Dictyostelium cf. discoideum]